MRSVPDVAFVIGNLVALQHASELILKTKVAMMLGLVANVAPHCLYLGEPDREGAVNTLPRKLIECGIALLDPQRGAPFQFFDYLLNAGSSR